MSRKDQVDSTIEHIDEKLKKYNDTLKSKKGSQRIQRKSEMHQILQRSL
jgi:hypothetical protein